MLRGGSTHNSLLFYSQVLKLFFFKPQSNASSGLQCSLFILLTSLLIGLCAARHVCVF